MGKNEANEESDRRVVGGNRTQRWPLQREGSGLLMIFMKTTSPSPVMALPP